ncbi:tol-pal system-associated acyl-CoA thioesterase [Tropicimonas sp. IMCC34011]|uniref:tol-pal system-associated acyl-CoA thioesterase n=1 Tax=Tropicimonas sp. IMCC34011 TaxID=2248759 RepID=UPI0021013C1B|nr:tol-pal system-associated acyl-CoA thioesterase [Tropicimonas sp. IMCC34011]
MSAAHRLPVTVWYEDTDMGGIVYHANYLKFVERGRSAWIAELGIDQEALRQTGTVFAVRRIEADYLAPARFADNLVVETRIRSIGPARCDMRQSVLRGETVLFDARVTLVAMGPSGRPTRLPAMLRDVLSGAT